MFEKDKINLGNNRFLVVQSMDDLDSYEAVYYESDDNNLCLGVANTSCCYEGWTYNEDYVLFYNLDYGLEISKVFDIKEEEFKDLEEREKKEIFNRVYFGVEPIEKVLRKR